MWFGRTPLLQRRTLKNGRPATARVRFALQGTDGDGNASWSELRGELEVAMPSGEVTVLRGLFNGHRKMSPYVQPGTELPVKLHPTDDDKLVIDWKAWKASGGLDRAKVQGDPGAVARANDAAYSATPADAGSPSQMVGAVDAGMPAAGGWQEQSIRAWQEAVASGHMSQEEYEQAVADLRAAGG